jgi:hypothetical protein
MLEVPMIDELNMSPATGSGSLRIVPSVFRLCMDHECLTRVIES